MNSLLNQITAIGESVQVSSVKFPGHLTLDTGIAVVSSIFRYLTCFFTNCIQSIFIETFEIRSKQWLHWKLLTVHNLERYVTKKRVIRFYSNSAAVNKVISISYKQYRYIVIQSSH